MRHVLCSLALALACAAANKPASAPTPEQAAAQTPAPPAAQGGDSETYHGTVVPDPFRWLEAGGDASVQAWSAAQNAHARAFLDRLPGVDALRARVLQLESAPPWIGGVVWRPSRMFAWRGDPAKKQQPWIVALPSLFSEDGVRTLVDPNAIDPSGHTTIDWFVPSPDGKKLAVSLSQRGSEAGTLHVFDAEAGQETGDVIARVQNGTGGGSAAWNATSDGFYYTRYPREGERPKAELDFHQRIYFHRLGTPDATDTLSLGDELPRIAEARLSSSEDGSAHAALVENGDSGDFFLWYLPANASKWVRVGDLADGIIDARFGRDGALWLISKKGAPRHRVLRMPLDNPSLDAARVILEGRAAAIDGMIPTQTKLYVVESRGGPSRVRIHDLNGQPLGELPAPPVSSPGNLVALDGDKVHSGAASYLQPFTGAVYDPATQTSTPSIIRTQPLADFSDAELIQETATSKDGTKVPLFIVQKKGTARDGNNPVVMTGYGGFGISERPWYSDVRHVWLEHGVVFVQTILRGGVEFGEEWHQHGRLLEKQNVFDDFIACGRRLVELGYTRPGKLGIEGGSNGGLLMGAAFTQEPDLFRAVVSHVGIYDMLRNESTANGQFNTVEYGSVKDEQQFKALFAYSPYHRVRAGVQYPAILMLTGANDPRVDPMQSRKMIARLQAADPAGTFLLRTSGEMGHGGIGAGVKDLASLEVDAMGFMLYELGAR